MKTYLFSFACLAILFSFPARAFDIASGGKAAAVIVTGENPAQSVAGAARELALHLRKMTGAEYKILTSAQPGENVIRIGAPCKTTKPDELRIFFSDAKTLELTGDMPRGPLYAVYTLVETLGVRLRRPKPPYFQEELSVFPQKPDLSIEDDFAIADAPAFEFREVYGELSFGRKWNARLRLNGSSIMRKIPPEFGGCRPFVVPEHSFRKWVININSPETPVDMTETTPAIGSRYLDPDPFFQSHPEWFAWDNTSRKRTEKGLCAFQPDAIRALAAELADSLAENPDAFAPVFFPMECAFCECPSCLALRKREGTDAAILLRIANETARELAKIRPGVKTLTMFGGSAAAPPKTMKADSSVFILFSAEKRDFGRPLSKNTVCGKHLEGWLALAPGRVYVRDYYCVPGNFLMPVPDLDLMADAMRFYRDSGVRGVFCELPWGATGDFTALKTRLFAALAWNPDCDWKQKVDLWLCDDYGSAAPFIRRYLEKFIHARDKKHVPLLRDENSPYLSTDDLLQLLDLLKKAEEALTPREEYERLNVRIVRAGLYALCIPRGNELAKEARKRKIAVPDWKTMLSEICGTAKLTKSDLWSLWNGDFTQFREHYFQKPEQSVKQPLRKVPDVHVEDLISIPE